MFRQNFAHFLAIKFHGKWVMQKIFIVSTVIFISFLLSWPEMSIILAMFIYLFIV
jgi:hypothetical protein